MKLGKLLSATLLLTSGSVFAENQSLEAFDLDCGKSMGLETVIQVKPSAKGSFKSLTATYSGPSVDATTGTLLRGHKISDFEGDAEQIKGKDFYVFVSTGTPWKQLYVEIPTQIGQKIEAAHMIMNNANNPYVKEFSCIVKKAKK